MAASNTTYDVPSWITGATVFLVIAAAVYVLVYGGELPAPGQIILGVISAGLGLFTLYLFYRFVVAVEKIADKY